MTSKPSTSDGRAHSISHVPGTHMRGTSASHSPRPFRPCADCTCSPGLLSRQGRRASLFLRQLENSRRSSSMLLNELKGAGGGSSAGNGSVYSCDSLCAVNRKLTLLIDCWSCVRRWRNTICVVILCPVVTNISPNMYHCEIKGAPSFQGFPDRPV